MQGRSIPYYIFKHDINKYFLRENTTFIFFNEIFMLKFIQGYQKVSGLPGFLWFWRSNSVLQINSSVLLSMLEELFSSKSEEKLIIEGVFRVRHLLKFGSDAWFYVRLKPTAHYQRTLSHVNMMLASILQSFPSEPPGSVIRAIKTWLWGQHQPPGQPLSLWIPSRSHQSSETLSIRFCLLGRSSSTPGNLKNLSSWSDRQSLPHPIIFLCKRTWFQISEQVSGPLFLGIIDIQIFSLFSKYCH